MTITAEEIPLAYPPKDAARERPHYLIDDIPDNEKMRLIRESGVLSQAREPGPDLEPDLEPEHIPSWMDALIYSIVLTGVYGLFEALVNQQYSVEITFGEVLQRMARTLPAIYFLVYLTFRYRRSPLVKFAMLSASCAAGCYFVHLNLHSPRLGIMRRAPGLVTLWMYLTFLMEVRPAIVSALVVCVFWLTDPFKTNI